MIEARIERRTFLGGTLDWLTPFALMCGLGVVAGYALLGSTWLMMKTEGPGSAGAGRWPAARSYHSSPSSASSC
jgi:cytochrome bd-type quinol oxidase subunit 2